MAQVVPGIMLVVALDGAVRHDIEVVQRHYNYSHRGRQKLVAPTAAPLQFYVLSYGDVYDACDFNVVVAPSTPNVAATLSKM
jgi:hypothetical protein